MTAQRRNALVAFALTGVIAVMVGLVAESETLYRLFCAATGYGGTTQRAAAAPGAQVSAPLITVRFNTEVDRALPWRFEPVQPEVRVRLGEQTLVTFRATNLSDHPVTGQALFNVTPQKIGQFFSKIQCFCFNEQTLAPHQTVDMPVIFFVDPQMARDWRSNDVDTITLSYTFYRVKSDPAS